MDNIERELRGIRKELERITAMGRPTPALLTREEFAEQLAVSVATVDRMVAAGEVHLARGSKRRRPRFPVSEVARLSAPEVKPKRGGGRPKRAAVDVAQEAAKVRAALRKKR